MEKQHSKKVLLACTLAISLIIIGAFANSNINTPVNPESLPLGQLSLLPELHCTVSHYRNGVLLSQSSHPMTMTTLGKDWLADKIAGLGIVDWSYNATWIGASNSSDVFDAAWTALPDEITTDGLVRTQGAVVDTGTGTWNCTLTWTATGPNSTKLYGLYYHSNASVTLIAAEQQGLAYQKNVIADDTITVNIQGTVG